MPDDRGLNRRNIDKTEAEIADGLIKNGSHTYTPPISWIFSVFLNLGGCMMAQTGELVILSFYASMEKFKRN